MGRWARGAIAWVMLGMVLWGGCGDGAASYGINVRFADDTLADRVRTVELSLTTACPDGAAPLASPTSAIARSLIIHGMTPYPSLKHVVAGKYCLLAVGRRADDCKVIAAGMAPVTLSKGGSGSVTVTLASANGGLCPVETACEPTDGSCTGICLGGDCAGDGGPDAHCDCPAVDHGDNACNADSCILTCDVGYRICSDDPGACCPFTEDMPIPNATGGLFAKVVADGEGNAYVVYTTATLPDGLGAVFYTERRGRAWSAPVEITASAYVAFDIALDNAGHPLIAYADGNRTVWVARWQPGSGTFSVETTAATSLGWKLDVGQTSTGQVQVGWFRGVSAYDGSDWVTDNFLTEVGNVDAAVLVGDSAVANAALTSGPPYSLHVIERVGGTTTDSPNVENLPTLAAYYPAQLELGGSILEFVYKNGTGLRYTRGRGSDWSSPVDLVANDPLAQGHFGLFANGTWTVVSYIAKQTDPAPSLIRFAQRHNDGTFTHVDVAATTTTAEGGTSVFVDPQNGLHLTYYDPVENVPRYVFSPIALTPP